MMTAPPSIRPVLRRTYSGPRDRFFVNIFFIDIVLSFCMLRPHARKSPAGSVTHPSPSCYTPPMAQDNETTGADRCGGATGRDGDRSGSLRRGGGGTTRGRYCSVPAPWMPISVSSAVIRVEPRPRPGSPLWAPAGKLVSRRALACHGAHRGRRPSRNRSPWDASCSGATPFPFQAGGKTRRGRCASNGGSPHSSGSCSLTTGAATP